MIFVGDVAIAPDDKFEHNNFPSIFSKKPLCINLEGAISPSGNIPKFGTCNSSHWNDSFIGFRLGPVFLANNHICDINDGISKTFSHLSSRGFSGFGAGLNSEQANKAVQYGDYLLLGFGWPVIGCKPATTNGPGTNRLEGKRILQKIDEILSLGNQKKLIVVMHWNYEFELYPQPAHRKFAKELIDKGVYAVVGHHPHIVSSVERHKGHTIAYSLGNWAFSYARFFNGQLRFPEESFHQVALELSSKGDVVHHARFTPPHTIDYQSSEVVSSHGFSLRPDFEGMSDQDYIDWFKRNRRKRKGLPIYTSVNFSLSNWVKDSFVRGRQRFIDFAVRIGLKSTKRRT